MGRTADSVLVSPLPDHMCSCVFLVPARTDDGTAHTVSSLPTSSFIVSVQHCQSHLY